MSIKKKALAGGIWLATFNAISQTFSWVATILVARILVPEDYGLMAMATILTEYVVLFSELGLGAAIIQREEIAEKELSSLFWFIVFWGFVLATLCFALAYPTAVIFNEWRLIRLTQSVSFLYILGATLVVPRNLLERGIRFKAVGFIEGVATVISCVMMIIIARLGGGVWTLISGLIIRRLIRVVLYFYISSWTPILHFNMQEIKPFLKFGLNIALARTLRYIYINSDRFFAGRLLGSTILGYYSFALQISNIPTDKVISFINRISYPVFSRYQKEKNKFNRFFLKLTELISFISLPLYTGGFFVADQLIPVALGDRWEPIVIPFKLLCISRLLMANTLTNPVSLNAKGLPQWNLYLTIVNALFLPISFYIAAKHGLVYMVIPWLTVEPIIRIGHTWATIKLLGVSILDYFKAFMRPMLGTAIMLFVLLIAKFLYFNPANPFSQDLRIYVITTVTAGAMTYGVYSLIFQRSLFDAVMNLRRSDDIKACNREQ